jgi:hypothetical protein
MHAYTLFTRLHGVYDNDDNDDDDDDFDRGLWATKTVLPACAHTLSHEAGFTVHIVDKGPRTTLSTRLTREHPTRAQGRPTVLPGCTPIPVSTRLHANVTKSLSGHQVTNSPARWYTIHLVHEASRQRRQGLHSGCQHSCCHVYSIRASAVRSERNERRQPGPGDHFRCETTDTPCPRGFTSSDNFNQGPSTSIHEKLKLQQGPMAQLTVLPACIPHTNHTRDYSLSTRGSVNHDIVVCPLRPTPPSCATSTSRQSPSNNNNNLFSHSKG